MKKILSVIGSFFAVVIGVPLVLLICVGYLLFVPFDIIRYHRTPYYKDFKRKYEFFITASDTVRLYNRIVLEHLPIEYVKHKDFEYFIKDGQVLLCGWANESFKQIEDEWFFILDNECDTTQLSMEEAISDDRELLKPEHKELPAKFLLCYDDIGDGEKFEQAKECPYFHCVFSVDEDI